MGKGRGVIILNSNGYYAKLDSILADEPKFIKINAKKQVIHPKIAKKKKKKNPSVTMLANIQKAMAMKSFEA